MTGAIVSMYFPTIIFLIIGFIMENHYSEFPNTFVGFHLKYAEKDRETWEEANKYAGRLCIRSSFVLLALDFGVTCCYIFFKSSLSEPNWSTLFCIYIFAALTIQIVLLIVLPYYHLKKVIWHDKSK